MTRYRVVVLPEHIVRLVRHERRTPQYKHPVTSALATGYGPCRACLRTFNVGKENRLLFTYNPFEGISDYPAPGPVFIHEEDCELYQGNELPADIRGLPLMLEGYDEERMVVARMPATGDAVDDALERVWQAPGTEYVHVRNAEAGCFIAELRRV